MRLFRPLDALVVFLLIVATVFAFIFFKGEQGTRAEIRLKNQKIATLKLNGPSQTKTIHTRIGDVRIRFGEGKIQVISSPCTHKICLLKGAIHMSHDHIICLPAQLSISILSNSEEKNPMGEIDAFTY